VDDLPRPSLSHPCVRQKRAGGIRRLRRLCRFLKTKNFVSFLICVNLRNLRMLLSCGAVPGSLARHSASGVSLSVIGQGTFAAAGGKRPTTKTPRNTETPSSFAYVFLVLLGVLVVFVVVPPAAARLPPGGVGWVVVSRQTLSTSNRQTSSVVDPRPSGPLPVGPNPPDERPFILTGPDHATLSHQEPAGAT